MTGSVAIDGRVAGTIDHPQASGAATLSGGSFSDATQGMRLDNIRGRLVARGEDVSIESASATTRNGGRISASGRMRLDPAGGFPGAIRINGRRAELVQTPVATAVLNLDLNLTGPLARDPRVSGRIEVVSLDITVPERLRPHSGLCRERSIFTRRGLRRRGSPFESKTKSSGQGASRVNPALDLTITAPGHILVHGRGLDAELGGSLRLCGTLAKPSPIGAFSLRRGRFSILTSRLEFVRGNMTFAGDFGPELDFLAPTQAGGRNDWGRDHRPSLRPAVCLHVEPRIAGGRDAVAASIRDALGPAYNRSGSRSGTGCRSILGGGDGAFESLRRSLGLGGLDVNLGASGGPSVGLQRALNSRVSVGVKAGATAAQTGVGVDVRVSDKVKVQGEIGSNGAASVGIGAEYEW